MRLDMKTSLHPFRGHLISTLSLLILFSMMTFPAGEAAETKYSEARVLISGKEDVRLLQQKGMQFDHIKYHQTYFDAVLSEQDLQILDTEGRNYQILIDDLRSDFVNKSTMTPSQWLDLQARMKEEYPVAGFEFGTMGGYYTFDEVVRELDSMRLVYPTLITEKQSIGTSIQGRNLWMVKISDNPDQNEQEPDILYDGLHHAREPQSMMTILYFMYYLLENYGTDAEVTDLVNTRELYFVPVVNPDGYVYNQQTDPNGGGLWRKNRRNNGDGSFGVDPNRNYGFQWGYDNFGSSPFPSDETYRGTAPFSEPENQAIRDFCNSHNIQLCLSYHSYGDLLIYPYGYNDRVTPDSLTFIDLASNMTQFNGYDYGTPGQTVGYTVNGSSDDWMYGEQITKPKIFSMTPEVGPWFWPSPSEIYPLAQENLYPNLVLAHGPGVIVVDAYDPNPPAEASAYSDYSTPTSTSITWTDPTSYAGGDTLTDFSIDVYRDASFVGSVSAGTESFVDGGLIDGQQYSYDLYTRDLYDSLSMSTNVSVFAGGAPQPNPPTGLVIFLVGAEILLQWTNPSTNIDGTPMDDFSGINLYEDGVLVAAFSRASADTGGVDSLIYTPTTGTHQYHVTAYDNEAPVNESVASNSAYAPLALPFSDAFLAPPVPSAAYWFNANGEVNTDGVNPPSPPYVLSLDGHPSGGDVVTLLPIDLSNAASQNPRLSYSYQPQGSGNAPEPGDFLYVELLNSIGVWITAESYPGSGMVAFRDETVEIAAVDPGTGATFFHPAFQFRFRNIGTASPTLHYDHWMIDDVSLEVTVTGVDEDRAIPKVFSVGLNYPNPFNPATTIGFDIPVASHVKMIVYNILGQKVKTLVDAVSEPGEYRVVWDGRNDSGALVGSGIYLYKFEAGEYRRVYRMVLVK